MKKYFISGIDTDAGKSYVTAGLAKFLYDAGKSVSTFKLVQTGCPEGNSIDIELHRRLAGMPFSAFDRAGKTFPAVFSYPASPHLAAELDHRELDFAAIESALAEVDAAFEYVLIEGAGGLLVPLTRELLTADYAARRQWPLILVTNGVLGSINHTLLSLEAAARRGMTIAAVVYNWMPGLDELIAEDARAFMQDFVRRHYPETLWIEQPLHTKGKAFPLPDAGKLFGGKA